MERGVGILVFNKGGYDKAEADAKATYAALVQAKNKEFNTLQASIEEIPSTYTAL